MTAPSINKSSEQKSTGIYTFSLFTLQRDVRSRTVLPHTRAVVCNVDKLMLQQRLRVYILHRSANGGNTVKGHATKDYNSVSLDQDI